LFDVLFLAYFVICSLLHTRMQVSPHWTNQFTVRPERSPSNALRRGQGNNVASFPPANFSKQLGMRLLAIHIKIFSSDVHCIPCCNGNIR